MQHLSKVLLLALIHFSANFLAIFSSFGAGMARFDTGQAAGWPELLAERADICGQPSPAA